MRRISPNLGQRNLVGPEGPLDREAVDLLRTGPPLGCPQDDRGPPGARRTAGLSRSLPNLVDLLDHLI